LHINHNKRLSRYGERRNPMGNGWDRYKEYFDQCTNLQAIELTVYGNSVTKNNLPKFEQDVWKERISYFQKRGIRLVDKNEIRGNENLKKKLAKEAGITWKFQFI